MRSLENLVGSRNPSWEWVSCRGREEFHGVFLGCVEVGGVIKEKVWV